MTQSSTFFVEDLKVPHPLTRSSVRIPGYRGIWYALGFKFEHGDKYSGGLGTYTANHQPIAEYAPAVNKTFFTYGGTPSEEKRELAIIVSYFDHSTGEVPRPVILYWDPAVDDPHDNASIRLDEAGYIWVFKSGRGVARPGIVFRSVEPYSIEAFELVSAWEFTYPQVRKLNGGGFFLLFTKYTFPQAGRPARNLFWKSSEDGRNWTEDARLASFAGHYQTSGQCGNKIATFFNWHPESDVDRRTNLYYAQTVDWGKTWTAADGTPLTLPLIEPENGALVLDYRAEDKCMYTCDLNFDVEGNPMLLHIASRKGEPGPKGEPREWVVLHWKNGRWNRRLITTSDHNYDMGSLYVSQGEWRVIGPTEPAPQRYGTGGEIAVWVSRDEGVNWRRERQITNGSEFNHSYARRPEGASDPFFAFWADGDPRQMSRSRLYFSDRTGSSVFRLPYEMPQALAKPEIWRAEQSNSDASR